MSWNLLIHLESGRQEAVFFDTRDQAQQALQTLKTQMELNTGLVTIEGQNMLLVDTNDIESAQVYDSAL